VIRRSRRLGAVAVILLLGSVLLAQPRTAFGDEDPRAEFMAALQRVQRHESDEPDSAALRAYVIYDYLLAARLRRDLAGNPTADLDTVIDRFVKAHAGEPVERPLKHAWLLSLANRRRWDWFLPRSIDASDAEVICDRLSGQLATGSTDGLAAQALARWELPQRQPNECNGVFAWLRSQNLLTPELAENRTRAALLANNVRLAQEFVGDVPAPRAAPLLQWIQLLEAPKAAVAMLAVSTATPVEADALVAGFTRLAIGDPTDAAALLPDLLQRPNVSLALRIRLQRALALGEASSRAPGAVASFSKLPEDAGDAAVQEWRVRAALWARDFPQALAWIAQMPPSLASAPRWRYWRARAVEATSDAATAAPLYAEISGMRDYYGYLAADRLQQAYNLNIRSSPDDVEVQSSLAAEPGLKRAHALFDCSLTDDAAVEWAAALSGAKPALKIQAARLASNWGWYAETIATLAQAGEWDDVALRYPRPYASIVAAASKESRIPDDWIFAIMRQESLFRKDAISRADARGLMQMQPATAVAVAHRAHLPAPSGDALFDPDIAVRFGALYVRELLDKYGQLDQTLAAYNAGPISLARWMPHARTDADIWIENIPYTETRGYVQHILEHIVAFATMRGAEPPRLSTLLPPVDPPAAQ
jgi:soluble lytic murein transglycosylase